MAVFENLKKISWKDLSKSAKVILPIFKKDSISEFVNEILREDESLRNHLILNPHYRPILEQEAAKTFNEYAGIIKGSKLVDSWDRVTSAIGMTADALGIVSGGLGNVISGLEEIPELIPKAVYAVYYGKKTKDWKSIPYWSAMEAASFIPGVGDAIDMTNIYVDRARKATKEKVKQNMRKILESDLEKKVKH
ncbi:MAG TPA: hypothetical protein PLK34_02250 [Candidatus Pacearchaeota archaeon]|nr:hypothetical protein [Candidatus Pacearchaeota archaeon]